MSITLLWKWTNQYKHLIWEIEDRKRPVEYVKYVAAEESQV